MLQVTATADDAAGPSRWGCQLSDATGSAVIEVEREGTFARLDPARGFWLLDRRSGAEIVRRAAAPPGAATPVVRWSVLPGGTVVEATWTDGTRVVANPGTASVGAGDLTLPPGGFAVDGPGFRAGHLLAGLGQRFREPTLFVLASRAGLSLEESTEVWVFRGFGDRAIRIANVHGQMQYRSEVITRQATGFDVPVEREEVVVLHDWYG